VFVHFWQRDERLEPAYRPDPSSRAALAGLAAAAGGAVVAEGDPGAVARAAREALGAGPEAPRGVEERVTPLAPWTALAALIPLSYVLRRRNVG
jgi:hypothetical protein